MYALAAVNSENLVSGFPHAFPAGAHCLTTAHTEGRSLNLLQHL